MDIFVARQPIYDTRNRVFGYELLYRSNTTLNAATGATAEVMASQVIIHTFVDIGLDRITGDKVAFLNCSQETLLGGFIELLSPKSLVVELLESVQPEPDVVATCERLRAAGYTLALDDFDFDPRFEPLLQLANIIKLDVLNRSADEIARMIEPVRPYGATLLAERVENAEVYEVCKSLGCELFQGYYFSRPEILSRREIATVHASLLRLMNLLRDDEVSDARVEEAFRSDVALTYKLLKIVNSAAVGGRGVESILHAVRLIGRAALSRWLALLLVASMASDNGPDRETALTAMARAHFGELLAGLTGQRAHAGPLFMVGVFSLLDAMMGMPMAEVLGRLDLAQEIKDALLERTGPYALPLSLVESYDRGEWGRVAEVAGAMGVDVAELPSLYLESLNWAQDRLQEATGS